MDQHGYEILTSQYLTCDFLDHNNYACVVYSLNFALISHFQKPSVKYVLFDSRPINKIIPVCSSFVEKPWFLRISKFLDFQSFTEFLDQAFNNSQGLGCFDTWINFVPKLSSVNFCLYLNIKKQSRLTKPFEFWTIQTGHVQISDPYCTSNTVGI